METDRINKTYHRVRLSHVPQDLEDVVTQHCFDCGATGISEALQFIQPDLKYDPIPVHDRQKSLDSYFMAVPGVKYFEGLQRIHRAIQWTVLEEEEKDWLAEWKKEFKPFALVEPFWIVPSWCESPVSPDLSLRIDPGMAFGTGTHATTQMAARFIQKALSGKPNSLVLDVGTGTGVLAILAARMGAGRVVGIEIDPEARRVACENLALNQIKQVEVSEQPLCEHSGQYDVVVANIIDGVLVDLKDDLFRVLKPGGDIFLTGILVEREEVFVNSFVEVCAAHVVRRWQHDEWCGYWLRKD